MNMLHLHGNEEHVLMMVGTYSTGVGKEFIEILYY